MDVSFFYKNADNFPRRFMKIMDIHFVKTKLGTSKDEEIFRKYLNLVFQNASDDEFFYLHETGRLLTPLIKALL